VTPEAAAWVRAHVIGTYHEANQAHWWCGPDQSTDLRCRCQFPCPLCRDGRHDDCRRVRAAKAENPEHQYGDSGPETSLRAPRPFWPYAEPDRPLYVAVWLADRVCRLMCPCETCARLLAEEDIPAASAEPVAAGQPEQLGLFAEVLA
jgi:hypothetical protein